MTDSLGLTPSGAALLADATARVKDGRAPTYQIALQQAAAAADANPNDAPDDGLDGVMGDAARGAAADDDEPVRWPGGHDEPTPAWDK